jgi:aryl-alcohol dehydrogenase (NADP+)
MQDPPVQYRQLGAATEDFTDLFGHHVSAGRLTSDVVADRAKRARPASISSTALTPIIRGSETGGQPRDFERPAKLGARDQLANQIGDDPNRGRLSRRWVLQAAKKAQRLGTVTSTFTICIRRDHATPLEGTVRAMGDLMRQGKIRYFGVSNYRAWRVARSVTSVIATASTGLSQPYYNAMNYMPEVERAGHASITTSASCPAPSWRVDRQIRTRCCARRGHRAGTTASACADRMAAGILQLAQKIRQHAEAAASRRVA